MIYLGADHGGYELKEKIKKWLRAWSHDFKDLGNTKLDLEDDFPEFGRLVAGKVAKSKGKGMGIVICRTGVGMDIIANRTKGVRCGLGFSQQQLRISKRDDDLNCLALAADFITDEQAKGIIQMFLETQFSGGEKYKRRIKKIEKK